MTDDLRAQKLSIWLRIVAAFLLWTGTRRFFFLLIGAVDPNYYHLSETGFGPLLLASEFLVGVITIAAGIAIWTRWRHAFMLATAALALYTGATLTGLQQASAHPEQARAAYAESRVARGIPVPDARLDQLFSPAGFRMMWITGAVTCLMPYALLLWRRRELE